MIPMQARDEQLEPAPPPEPAVPPAVQAHLDILILNSHLPVFPGGGGVEYLTTLYSARHARRIGLVSLAHSRSDLEKVQGLARAGVGLYLWESPYLDSPPPQPRPSLLRTLHGQFRILVDNLVAGSRPVDTLVLDRIFRNMAPHLHAALSEQPWQVVSVVESSAAAMIDYIPRHLVSVLVMHDIRALVYQRQAEVSKSPIERRRLMHQARRYYAFERAYCRRYDLVTTVSESDAAWVRRHYQPRNLAVVPLPVDEGYFQPADAAERPGRIVFTGLMNHPPNADAAIFFAREVLPQVRAAIPAAEFYVVGRHPTPEVQALAALPGVQVTGGVPDIRPYLAEAAVVVVPLRFGSGARQKILEAWCMRKCVVSTSVGAEGLEYQAGANLVIADDAPALASAVVRALHEPALREQLRHGGLDVVRRRHNPPQIAADYYARIEAVARVQAREEPPMRVAIDMRWMIPGLAGGLETLARSFVQTLLGLDRSNAYTLILPARCSQDFDLRRNPNVRVVSPDSLRALAGRALTSALRRLYGRLRLDFWKSPEVAQLLFAREVESDIVYSFPGYIYPDVWPLRHVLMVPDIQHEYLPEFFSEDALAERRRLYADAIGRATRICAISEFTRRSLIERLGVAPERVTAIPLAADPRFSLQADPVADAAILRRYGLAPGEYLYFPAHTWHHKNHQAAVAALGILRDRHGLRPTLVCSGGAREAQPLIEQRIAELGLENQVRFLGYLPHDDIPVLYRGAAALLFPSLFEGFGMPVLEAMACGCPVVCSNTTSLPEIGGDAALFADPADPEAFADALARLLRDTELRAELRARGLAQAARFSWRRHTLETVGQLYETHRHIRNLT